MKRCKLVKLTGCVAYITPFLLKGSPYVASCLLPRRMKPFKRSKWISWRVVPIQKIKVKIPELIPQKVYLFCVKLPRSRRHNFCLQIFKKVKVQARTYWERLEGKQCRLRWGGSLWATSSRSILFANSAIFVTSCRKKLFAGCTNGNWADAFKKWFNQSLSILNHME